MRAFPDQGEARFIFSWSSAWNKIKWIYMNPEFSSIDTNQLKAPHSNSSIIITIIATALIVGLGSFGFFAYGNLKNELKSERQQNQALSTQLQELRAQIASVSDTSDPLTDERVKNDINEGLKTIVGQNKKNISQEFVEQNYGISFSYPGHYQISIAQETGKFTDGAESYKFEIIAQDIDQQPRMILLVNPGKHGPYNPDKLYELKELADGSLSITAQYSQDSVADDKVVIVPSVLDATNGNSYAWVFSFDQGEQDFENEFKSILQSVKIFDTFNL